MTRRFRWILVGLMIGLVSGGVAYAVVVNPPNTSDRYFACVSNVGVVKAGTVRLNTTPIKCPNATDEIHSWSAGGSSGATGATGATGAPGATGATGTAGTSGPLGIKWVETSAPVNTMNGSGTNGSTLVWCPEGSRAVAGSYWSNSIGDGLKVTDFAPMHSGGIPDLWGWRIQWYYNTTFVNGSIGLGANCVPLSQFAPPDQP